MSTYCDRITLLTSDGSTLGSASAELQSRPGEQGEDWEWGGILEPHAPTADPAWIGTIRPGETLTLQFTSGQTGQAVVRRTPRTAEQPIHIEGTGAVPF